MSTKQDLTTTAGFTQTYFDLLPFYKTSIDTFAFLNKEVEFITSNIPFKNYGEFKTALYGSDES